MLGQHRPGDFLYPNDLPKKVISSGVHSVATGSHHSCAVTMTGGVKCWGDNSSGEVGVPTSASTEKPVTVPAFG